MCGDWWNNNPASRPRQDLCRGSRVSLCNWVTYVWLRGIQALHVCFWAPARAHGVNDYYGDKTMAWGAIGAHVRQMTLLGQSCEGRRMILTEAQTIGPRPHQTQQNTALNSPSITTRARGLWMLPVTKDKGGRLSDKRRKNLSLIILTGLAVKCPTLRRSALGCPWTLYPQTAAGTRQCPTPLCAPPASVLSRRGWVNPVAPYFNQTLTILKPYSSHPSTKP